MYFISKDVLDKISYESTLGKSLKQISLRKTSLEYQRDNLAYPIEIQLWCAEDYQFNVWRHKLIYKYHTSGIGKHLYEKYRLGEINTEEDFKFKMIKLTEGCEKNDEGQ